MKKSALLVGALGAAGALTGFAAKTANKNLKEMQRVFDHAEAVIAERLPLTEQDCGEYRDVKVMGAVHFHVKQYKAEGFGNISVMSANMAAMQMETVIFTPADKNLPLFSVDYIYMMNTRKCFLEFYDLVAEQDASYKELLDTLAEIGERYSDLEEVLMSPAWYDDLKSTAVYKKAAAKDDQRIADLLNDLLGAYLDAAQKFPALTEEQKAEKAAITKNYTDGLVDQGGAAADNFKKALGDDETKKFFDKVLFGIN